MFILAAITAPSASGPVKIRNLSPSGALIEGATLPSTGERMELRRGANFVRGNVVWCQDGKAGLRFDGQVEVAEWMSRADAGQQRVDRIVEQAKAGAATPSYPTETSVSRFADLAPADLRNLALALDSLADDLADDAAVVARLGAKLQSLDIVSQVLRRLSDPAA
jgi:hypothetical protein